ncbi:transposase [Reinekea marinisedimentorum]|nr:transposase [Reinekea marinisedimentorum]
MKWYSWATKSRLTPMKTAAKSIKEKLWGIINAIVKNRTNAMAESINAKLKIIKVRAKGFRSETRYKTAIMFYLGGLTLKH